MTSAFDAQSLTRSYAFLDDCPDHLIADVVTLPYGSLQQRVAGVRAWRDALLAGHLPPTDAWPPPPLSGPARRSLETLGLARFCKGQPELVDSLLKDLLSSFTRQADRFRSEVTAMLRELEALERKRLEDQEALAAKLGKRKRKGIHLDEATLERLRARAERDVAQAHRGADDEVEAAWGERARNWGAIAEVFGDLGELMGRGWDLSQGVLKHTGWQNLLRLRELVEKLPQLREIVQSLGRLQTSDAEETVADVIFQPVRRLEEERRAVRTPLIPAETRGIERSGDIARMLPVEAMNLGHPKLRMLWHARRAERALLTYRVEGVDFETVMVETESQERVERRRPRTQRGPIVAIVDTSGSMHGLPERVAKALVLEALRTAHVERRRCFLYLYSGPSQVLEQELDLSPEGVGRLLLFMCHSFGGGNDEAGVLARVLKRLEEEAWKKADVLFVSDGEWPAPRSLLPEVAKARAVGTRLHGVQIGNRGRTGLHAVCDPVHVFQDWATAGGW